MRANKHQGFNFSPEFNFIVENKEEKWILLEDNTWVSRKSIFNDEVVENVSAIVGRNGAGKTTLLDYLSDLDCSVPHTKGEIRKIQRSILKYLKRIQTPEWLKSGKKSESYITNCQMHKDALYIRTMDICHFYDAVSYKQIEQSFCEVFKMAPDIARITAKLVTNNKTIPTGSPSSQLIVYWVYRDMFEEINSIALRYGCKFSLYVDDMTFSAQKQIPRQLREDVVEKLNPYGLHAKRSKDHYFGSNDYKIVTGCGIKQGIIDVPNRLRQIILHQYRLCQQTDRIDEIEKLNGLMCSARQMDGELFPSITRYLGANKQRLKEYSKSRQRNRGCFQ